jgi:hypothetical protein
MLLACNLIGLFDDKSVTSAPVYDSKENENSDVIDDTSVDMEDDVISSTHEKDAHAEGISGGETAEDADGNIGNKGSQEVGNEMASGDSAEYSEISNPHAKDDVAKSQNVSDEEERENENESSNENKHTSLDNTLTEEENKDIPVPEFGKEDADATSDESEGKGEEEKEKEEEEKEQEEKEEEEKGEEEKEEDKVEEEKEEKEKEEEGGETTEETASTETDGNDAHLSSDGDEETERAENSDEEADFSSSGLNQGSLASSELTINDEDKKSIAFTEAPDSDMPGDVDDNSKSSDLAEAANGEGSAGDGSEADEEHEEGTSGINENHDTNPAHVSSDKAQVMNENDSDGQDSEERNISQEGDSDAEVTDNTPGTLDSSSEDNIEDQKSSVEGNDSEAAESSIQGTTEGDDHHISKEDDSGTDIPDGAHRVSDASSEDGTDDQNSSVEGNGQLDGSNVKPDTESNPGASSDNISLSEETSTNCNCSTTKIDVPETTEISHKPDYRSEVLANADGNHGEDEDIQFGASVENAVTKSVSGSENNTLIRVQKENIKQGDDDGINEPGLGSQRRDSASSGSIGSYIVLGVIMAVIVVLLGYSVLKGRGRRAQDAKGEDFGTEMSDVKKNLLPRNEFKDEIQPNTHLEEDESNAKLLPAAQRTGDNVQSGETGVAVQNGVDSQKELGGNDSHTKEKINFDKIETQLEPTNSPAKTSDSQNQKSNNPLKEAFAPKKQEKAKDQNTHQQLQKTPSHQNANNNVNGLPQNAVETVPVQTHGGYVSGYGGVPGVVYGGYQQPVVTMPPPVQLVRVEQGCVPTVQTFVTFRETWS